LRNPWDVHAFAPDRLLVLGGVTIPYERGLDGHSDGDALTHALVDALLGAATLGDLGSYFPSNDSRWKGQPGKVFLASVFDVVCWQHQWRIGNIDATIVDAHIPAMRSYLAEHLHVERERVSVKATTTDALGFAGRGEGIACYAVVLLERDGRED